VTEVPEYLLQRSKERRAAMSGEDAGESAPVPAESSAPAEAAPAAPAPAPTAEIEKVEPPKPLAPWVQAAQERKKIPLWMAPVALFLPIWAFMIWGTLEEPTREAEGPVAAGGAIYAAQCATCHGAGGGGGVGYQLNGGEVLLTFPDVESHVAWVVNGSPAPGTPFGDPGRPGGQRLARAQGNMPGFSALEAIEIMEVVLYERVTHGEQSEEDLEAYILWTESGELPEWQAGVTPEEIVSQFEEFLASNPAAAEAAGGEA
jgi:mono/diheme cytochrome c family protein